MGKVGVEEEQPLPTVDVSLEQNEERRGASGCCGFAFESIGRLIGLRCLLVLLLSVAVFLSAVFWLPPFLHFADQDDLDLDSRFKGHDIVASFTVNKPVSILEDNILQLEDDIFYEISVLGTKVVILSLEPLAGSNTTKVVFGVDPDTKYSKLSSTAQSLVRAAFEVLVINDSSLRLTKSLFGDSLSFDVLKFPGGITIIPPQSAFLLQKVQILFNFTLNFSIYQIRENFAELTSQLKSGLHLMPYENLYVSLSNSEGSTVAPPTTVQSSVLLAVGNAPSLTRLKQLAQTITGHSRNLGLNNTVFGRVKQVRLSSILQHSLHGGDGSGPSPSPAPLPHHHHYHHQHHHHHHDNNYLYPAISPSPAPATKRVVPAPVDGSPAPVKGSPAPSQSGEAADSPGCQLGHKREFTGNGRRWSNAAAPTVPPQSAAASPMPHKGQMAPKAAPISSVMPPSSPLPSVVFAHVQPPSKSEPDKDHSETMPSVSPSPSPFSSSAGLPTVQWAILLSLALVLQL